MTMDESFKGRFVILAYEGLQQLPIRPPRRILRQHDPAKMLNDPVYLSGCQVSPSLAGGSEPLPFIARPRTALYTFFLGRTSRTDRPFWHRRARRSSQGVANGMVRARHHQFTAEGTVGRQRPTLD